MSTDALTTSNPSYIPSSNGYANSQTIDRTTPTSATVGAGSAAGVSQAPDLLPGLAAGVVMASLAAIMPRMSGEQLDVLVASFTEKAKDVSDASEKDQINTQQAAKRAAIEQKKANIDTAIKKQAEADEKMKHASVWDKIKLAFEYIGAIATIIGGILAMATAETGVGAVAGVMMIMSGICMLTMAVDSTVQMAQQDEGKGDLGMFGMMCKDIALSRGKTEEEAEDIGKQGAMGASIALGALSAAFGIASAGVGAASAIKNVVQSLVSLGREVGEMAEQGATLGERAAAFVEQAAGVVKDAVKGSFQASKSSFLEASTAEKVGKAAELGVDITGDVSSAAGAGADIGSGVDRYQASTSQSEAKTAQANSKRFEALQQSYDDTIDLMMKRLKSANDSFNEVLDGVVDAMNDRGRTLTNMQFRA